MNNQQVNADNEARNRNEAVAPNFMRTGRRQASDIDHTTSGGVPFPSQTISDRTGSLDSMYVGIGAGLIGIGAGLATMYFLDPDRGRRRRSVVTDKISKASNRIPGTARVTVVDLSNRARGAWATATKMFSSDTADDQIIEARVRSKMGRVCSHPHAIHVISHDGYITLDGVILADEAPYLLKCVSNVRGVHGVTNNLKEFKSSQGVSSLQGGRRREDRSEFMQQHWSPGPRFIIGALGASGIAYALVKRDLVGVGLGIAGAALLTRSLTNSELTRLGGFTGGRSVITVEKSINVSAPADVLYALWSNFENFPQFMTNVLEVRNVNDDLSHWKVAGPAGIPVEWDAEITRIIPNEMIAWKSLEDSAIPNAGYVVFEPNADDSTEVTVRLSYSPPAGAIGHALAKVFGADPKSEMDADLMRMKSLLETGSIPHDAAQSVFGLPRGNRVH
ncbi:MAG TPA: SRPBCC family protein [Pyrinomonadaceae bacterium]|nr:SRPBCC family protein [Pyrinomonadaceae bacterium]